MASETLFSNKETTNSKQIAILKKHFPQCFDKNGSFMQDRMMEVIESNEVELSKESYSLNWLGKSYAKLMSNLPPKKLMGVDAEHNSQPDNKSSKHLLFKGDNLEVLKHLVNTYGEEVHMIYIDPPYNTGKDGFAYNDDRKFTKEQLSELAGIDLDEAERILKYTVKGDSSHSAWLTFMYPRLHIARELLRDDGVIFISLDDNELAQLRVLCDEVFGEQNFLGNVIWKNVTDNNPTNIATEHEYIVAYAKSRSHIAQVWKSRISDVKDNLIELGEKLIAEYDDEKKLQAAYSKWFKDNKFQLGPLDRYKLIDKGGIYINSQSVHNPGKEGYRYDVIHPETKKPCKQPLMGYRFKESTMQKLIDQDKIIYGKDHNKIIELKLYLSEFQEKFSSVLELDGRIGANELRSLFPEMKQAFTNPKSTQLIEMLISYVCEGEGIICDFFAGSGTTAHAVMNLNHKENQNYRFITVQLDEPAKEKSEALSAGYETIFDVTKERLIRASAQNGNQGFKIYSLVEDFRVQDEEIEFALENLTMFDDVVLNKEQYDTLLTTWRLHDGSDLADEVIDVEFDGYVAHLCDNRLYMLESGITSEGIKALILKLDTDESFSPNKVVFYGANFDSGKQRELKDALKNHSNKKSIEIDVMVRN
ncbi:TPA: site-specific DNA-methyltransferase [Vibrio parahaemolyticus]|uniref:site-specific DNA-methyltransferase n=4 Tax=Vibrio TaxID=662 RepID=UPI00084B7D8D|nr:site-specific DNA-methyltransferase [Vibrio parahaemolyticus]EJU9970590.1 site-specific DNA-methyltransferase [Vibrio alginolyticus]GIB55873.1 type III restriction endonuclease subunit M [Vibrio cholerae]EHZ2723641.1 site-specific DNA-methyltransferase [Vibrio parahaemolyticus]EIV1596362.1 site-specific DNA-methyltransferase [Vibrio parahaemolyticus]ELA6777921.1 site-specific DNA-methyltransferase [Vibrio alginolyticus]